MEIIATTDGTTQAIRRERTARVHSVSSGATQDRHEKIMPIAASMPRRAPDRNPWRSPPQADGHVDGRLGDQTPSTMSVRIGGFGARAIQFGPFCLLPEQRLLLQADKPVSLGSRALDILIALVERRGELVSKRELMARVWPDTLVVDSNLSVHIAALRRVLQDGRAGNRYMVNIPGRGYSFVAPVTFGTDLHSAAAAAPICSPAIQLFRSSGITDGRSSSDKS
jgi:DNA-binding winged helix-turn-helix (wHTH) protein